MPDRQRLDIQPITRSSSERSARRGRLRTGPALTSSSLVGVALVWVMGTFAALAPATPAQGIGGSSAGTDDPPVTAPADAASRKRVHVLIDRFREQGGFVITEDDRSIEIERDGRRFTYERNRVLGIVELVEVGEKGHIGIVIRRDGNGIEGLILDDGFDEVVVQVEGIRTTISRREVLQVTLLKSVRERYDELIKAVGASDLEGRIEIARWLASEDELDLARTELLGVLDQDDHPEARLLLREIDARISLRPTVAPDEVDEPSKPPRLPADRDELPARRLTMDDVNLIRVYEIDFNDPPNVTVDANVVRELVAEHADDPRIPDTPSGREALFAMDDLEIVRLMFEVRARDLYPRIQVENDPPALARFRQRVHDAWLIPGCATSGCHGGPDAGRFFLHRTDFRDPRTAYENLLILERLRVDERWKLVDYERPEQSLIVQYGLPRNQARLPHPEVRGWRPILGMGRKQLYEESIRWVRSMYQPRPDYPIEYVPPGAERPVRRDRVER